MTHFASPSFWSCYEKLPVSMRHLADKNFELLKHDTDHPSLRFKKIGRFRSARVGIKYRALAVEISAGCLWIWIGSHSEYDKLIHA